MPRGDGTGPMGVGAVKGHGFGFKKNNFTHGIGCYGLGTGYGCIYGYEEINKEMLKKQKEILQIKLNAIEKLIQGN